MFLENRGRCVGLLWLCTLLSACAVAAYCGFLRRAPAGPVTPAGFESPLPIAAPSTQPVEPQLAGNWKLTFRDEFTGPSLKDIWTPHQYWDDGATDGEGDEKSDPANISIGGGMLELMAAKDRKFGTPYTGALVQAGGIRGKSLPTFSFLFGYIEASIQIPAGQGLWPAFWMMPASYHDSNGEIDIVDNGTGNPKTLHGGAILHGKEYQHQHPTELASGFHTFAVDWQRDQIRWYVDGKEWARTADPKFIPTEAMYPIFDLAVGGKWGGPPNASTHFPAIMRVDWIRVWQRS
jgi:beta-glucanase (GH16 family)